MTHNKNSTRYYSNKQEQSVAKVMKSKQVANSGACPFTNGDVISEDILYECKTSMTGHKSYAIKQEVLNKLKQEAFQSNKPFGVLVFNFGPNTQNHYILTEEHLKYLLNK